MQNQPSVPTPSIPLAVMDALTALLFCGTAALLAALWPSPLFIMGGILCALAGCGKAAWKLILAVSGRDVRFLNRQFRYLTGGGFLLILLALIIGHEQLSLPTVWKYVAWFPGNLCFLLGALGMISMGVVGAKPGGSSAKANRLGQSIHFIAQLAAFLGVLLCWYGSDCYPADDTAVEAAKLSPSVTVTETENGLFFDGAGEDTALVFYPGAKVEYTAYAPLMRALAADGIDCFLLEMPYHLAIFGIDSVESVTEHYDYERVYLAGHSLGGAMAASYAADNPEALDGLILLAAYPTKELPEDLPVLTLYGSEDGVLSREKLAEGEQYLPDNAVTVCIDGGNHAQFGSYGAQDGDRLAAISAGEQLEQTEAEILTLIRGQ